MANKPRLVSSGGLAFDDFMKTIVRVQPEKLKSKKRTKREVKSERTK